MTVSISFDSNQNIFHLRNDSMSYIMEVVEERYLAHAYWGRALPSYQKSNQIPMSKKTFAATPSLEKPAFSLEFLPQEFPHSYQGDYKQSALSITREDGNDMLRLVYQGYEIRDGLLSLDGLPHAREFEGNPAKTLTIFLLDEVVGLEVRLFYSIFEYGNVILRWTEVKNTGTRSLTLQHVASASFDLDYSGQSVTTLHGSHQAEFQIQHQDIGHGQFRTGTTRGASGPQYSPFLAISQETSEYTGDVHAMTLMYSGNHEELVERDQYDQLRLQMGLSQEQFAWKLDPEERFASPQAVLVYSPDGFNGMSQEFHQFSRNHVMSPRFREQIAPILINSWEMTYFDVDEKKMTSLIDKASDLGFEAVVLDDGWFLGRNNSRTSLGDWSVDPEKFPNDLHPLIEQAHQKGLKFGIWFEPEMISPTSQLHKEHPDWVLKSLDYDALYGRSQFVLDLSQKVVQDFVLETLKDFLKTYPVDYIKWDMNRHITEPFSQKPSNQHPKAISHQYMLGLYRIVNDLVDCFPDVLFENCSSGGGRFDFGMLYYFPQTWASDNTDALDRQLIQYGASYLFHPYQMTGHVSATPNHQTQRMTPLDTRMALASSTNMGYELNILEYSEQESDQTIQHIKQYKKDRTLIQTGNFYRLCSPDTSRDCAWLFESQDKKSFLLTAFCNQFQVTRRGHVLKIPYLQTGKLYFIEELNRIISGDELKYAGLQLSFEPHDLASLVLHIQELE